MDFSKKFNRPFLKAIAAGVRVIDLNAGAIRSASVKFKFFHAGENFFYELTAKRNAPGLEFVNYPEKLTVDLFRFNQSYLAGSAVPLPNFIDVAGLELVKEKSITSEEEAVIVQQSYMQSLKSYAENML